MANATILDILLNQIRKTKLTVGSTIEEVQRTRNNTQQDVDQSIINSWQQQKKKHSDYANTVLNTIRKKVENAEAKGKDARHCYDTIQSVFHSIDYASHNSAQQCQECGKQSIKTELSFIKSIIETGYKQMEELDKIFPECYKKYPNIIDIFKLHSCIRKQLKISKDALKKLKAEANSAKVKAKFASKVVVEQAISCLKDPYSIARKEIEKAKSFAINCVDRVM
ncbi:hypothetical protein PUN28_015044 [Cardiocondyla obscurior]|uniref:Uncharacterized protein n=1 Tax=Cardiocondyla obscurior TaxID=286306 RepID=A0AAW2EWP7_9HYME